MMFTTRSWSSKTVLLFALLSKNCQSNSPRVIAEEEPVASACSASTMRQCTPGESPPAMQSLVSLSASPAAHVSSSRLAETLAHGEEYPTVPSSRSLIPSAPPALAAVGNSPKDSKLSAKRQSSNPAQKDDRADKRARAGEGADPDEATELLKALLVVTQVDRCRQPALETLTSPDMLSSLRAAAKAGAEDVRLRALKTLGEIEWRHYFGEVGPVPDLPGDVISILDASCPFWPEKQVKDTHLLVLIPAEVNGQPLSLNLLRDLIQHPKNGGKETRYRCYRDAVKARFGAASPAESYWLLMTRDVLPGSCYKSYRDQKEIVAAHVSAGYELPGVLEAATAILTHHVRDGERLYSDNPWTYTRCKESVCYRSNEYSVFVGGFEASGLDADYLGHSNYEAYGVAGCRRLDKCVRREVLNLLLDVAVLCPDRAIQFLDILLVAAQDNDCRQQALAGLGNLAQASPAMFSECLPSLRTAANKGDKHVRLLALKTLGEIEWKYYFGEVDPAPDLPSNMTDILDSACPFWPEKQVKDTHLLALIPAKVNGQPFSLNLFKELIQNPKNGGHKTQYQDYDNSSLQSLIDENSTARSYWLLMTSDVLPESRNKTYANQQEVVADYARVENLPYKVPKVLEAATAILTHYVRDGGRLYGNNPQTYTCCQEWFLRSSNEQYPVSVGSFGSLGLGVLCSRGAGSSSFGIAGCRRFFAEANPNFGEKEWRHYFGEVGPVPDLPSDIDATLDSACSFWPGEKIRDTHLLVLIPARVNGQPFSLNLLRDLIQDPKNSGHKTQYHRFYDHPNNLLRVQFGAASPSESYWLLMTRDVLPGSRDKSYGEQKKLAADHARDTKLPYELPRALEAATAILTHHVRDGERLYGGNPWTFTCCQELISCRSVERPAVVGGFESSGLYVADSSCDDRSGFCGVAGLRKF
jgi:hypothetical protein